MVANRGAVKDSCVYAKYYPILFIWDLLVSSVRLLKRFEFLAKLLETVRESLEMVIRT